MIEAIILDTKPNKASVETLPVIHTSDANNTEYNASIKVILSKS